MTTNISPNKESLFPSEKRESLLRELGVEELNYRPDQEAPPLDLDMVRRYTRHELDPEESRRIGGLIARFRAWSDGYGRMLRDERSSAKES